MVMISSDGMLVKGESKSKYTAQFNNFFGKQEGIFHSE